MYVTNPSPPENVLLRFGAGLTDLNLPLYHCAAGIDKWLLQTQKHKQRSCPLCKCDPLAAINLMTQHPVAPSNAI